MKYWDHKKNKDLNLDKLTLGSKKAAWWKCSKGHEWEATVNHISNGTRCPYCSNKKILKGYNDLGTTNPELLEYLDHEKNEKENIDVSSLSRYSHVKVYWKCKNCGTKFSKLLPNIKEEVLCNSCALKIGIKNKYSSRIDKEGSLVDRYPEIVKEWHPTKNGDLKPESLTYSSGRKVWWKCSKGHEWEAVINSRTGSGRGCPICANQKVLKGYNDLATIFPEFLPEWNYKKNKVSPSEIIARTGKKYWWICKLGHEYEASPLDRFYGRGCSICNTERSTSIGEKTILYYIQQNYKGKIIPNFRDKKIKNKEIDIFLPNLLIGVEYDGIYFHKNKLRDKEKDKICLENGIKIIHIAESKMEDKIEENYIYYNVNKFNNIEFAIHKLLNILFGKKEYDINISRDRIKIYNLIDYYEKEKSLLNNYPEIAKEWHPTKNGKLQPEFVSYGSSKKVWWKCKLGHEYEAIIYSRIRGSGCPYCAGQKVLEGYNDLKTKNPELAKEWHSTKNGDLKSEMLTYASNKKVWWKCSKGHEWEASIYSRNNDGRGCPYCANQKVLKGYNDLKTKNSELAKEWHPTKNNNLTPNDVIPNSHKKVWWKCSKGHEWEATIGNRNRGTGCPKCAKEIKD